MKKVSLLAAALMLALTLTGCVPTNRAPQATPEVDLILPTKAGEESGTEEIDLPNLSDQDFSDDIAGLCEYLEKSYAVADEKVQMSYDVIDAVDGYRYLFRYNRSTVQVELYAFDLGQLTDAAKTNLETLQAGGKLTVINNEIDAVISDNGKYVMIYSDKSGEETNLLQKQRVTELLKGFHAE